MTMMWASTAAGLSLASSGASFLTMVHLRCRWDVHTSSVRWLFWLFFSWICARCTMRSVFFVWMSMQPSSQRVDESDPHSWTYGQLDRLGIHGVQFLPQARSVWITAVIGAGDVALAGIAVTLFPLAYELCRLARIAMDRGKRREREQIKRYRAVITCVIALYAAALIVLAIAYDGYSLYTHRCLLGVYGVQVIGLIYMVAQLVLLNVNGRKYETIHGVFVASPVYKRLKQIMLVYAVFAFQFQLSMIVNYLHKISPDSKVMNVIGISLILNNSFGLALSITTSCSQTCVFQTCARCLPEDLEAQFVQQQLAHPHHADLEAPRANPVFVYTDIQSSTALWNKCGAVMGMATEIHDNILRSSLLKHRGYEITTAGDAFQLAFHTIQDAVEYCLDVQLQLLVAKWPRGIHGVLPAVEKERSGRRVVFNGLRVRMGIHDACEDEGRLVHDIHAVTRKTIYSGMSEIIAEYVGDLGSGGQILLTERVAAWLKHHREDLSVDVFMQYLGEYAVPQVNLSVEIYQLQPAMLATRVSHFEVPTIRHIPNNPSATEDDDLQHKLNPPTSDPSRRFYEHSRGLERHTTADTFEDLMSPMSNESFKLLESPRPPPQQIQPPPLQTDLAYAA